MFNVYFEQEAVHSLLSDHICRHVESGELSPSGYDKSMITIHRPFLERRGLSNEDLAMVLVVLQTGQQCVHFSVPS